MSSTPPHAPVVVDIELTDEQKKKLQRLAKSRGLSQQRIKERLFDEGLNRAYADAVCGQRPVH